MQRLFPSPYSEPSEASNTGPAAPSPKPAEDAPEPEPTAPVRPFAWPPPEEDLDDWHVFQFGPDTPTVAIPAPTPASLAQAATAPPPAKSKASDTPTLKLVSSSGEHVLPAQPAPEAPLAHLDLRQESLVDTAELGTRSPFAKVDPLLEPRPVVVPFTTPDTAPVVPFATPDTAPLAAAPTFATPDTAPVAAAPTFATPETAPIANPAPLTPEDFSSADITLIAPANAFRTPDTAPLGTPVPAPLVEPLGLEGVAEPLAPPVAEPKTSTAAAALALSGALAETGTSLPARRTMAPADPPLMSATVEVIARSAQSKQPRVARPAATDWLWVRRAVVIALALLAIGEAAYIATLRLRAPVAASQTGALFVQSQPAGAEILVDGKVLGRTPFRLELPPGQHVLELKKDNLTRKFPLVIAAGSQLSQYVEMRTGESETSTPAPPPAAPAATPQQAITPVAPPPVRPVPTTGWLLVQSNIQLSVLRNGESIGNSDDGKLTLGAGNQELELSNTAAGYREATTIRILPGQITTLRPDLPQSTLDIESSPNAKVVIDGHDVGETPLAPIALTIGPHEIVFKHPDFPDRRVTTFIKVATPSHVSIDLSVP